MEITVCKSCLRTLVLSMLETYGTVSSMALDLPTPLSCSWCGDPAFAVVGW